MEYNRKKAFLHHGKNNQFFDSFPQRKEKNLLVATS